MPRPGEYTYYERIGPGGRTHALDKPFSDHDRGPMLMEAGAVLELIPPGTRDILECGCGPGWLSYFLAKSGYCVVGQDVSTEAIQLARENPMFRHVPEPPEFVVCDFEELGYREAFDAVVFFHALHHAVDERKALQAAYRALRPGGVVIAAEPGAGHSQAAAETVERFDVTDRDMPPLGVIRVGKEVGFRDGRMYPHAQTVGAALYRRGGLKGWLVANLQIALSGRNGITVLTK